MASIQNLKKNIHYTLGDIIDLAMTWEDFNPEKDKAPAQAIIDEAIASFDVLMTRVNAKNVENKKAHYKGIAQDLETQAMDMVNKLNQL
ncbi:MAG: hypothetical protein ACPGRE_03245 [Flavobacteriaceae bacterium]